MRYLYKRITFIIKRYLNCYQLLSLKKLSKLKTSFITTFGYFLSYLIIAFNLLLIVVCYPGILNPGPIISGLYHNVRGFVPFRELNEAVPPLSTSKLQDFHSYLFSKNPGLVILNETWLTNEHFDNEIFPNNSYKVFRSDRSPKTHPFDPLNPQKYRKRGGGILIAIKSDLNIESKMVGTRCKAEILSIEMKCGNDIFCITTC